MKRIRPTRTMCFTDMCFNGQKLFSTAMLGSIVNRQYLSRVKVTAARSIVAMPRSLFQ